MKNNLKIILCLFVFLHGTIEVDADNFTRAGYTLIDIYKAHASTRRDAYKLKIQYGDLEETVFFVEPFEIHIDDQFLRQHKFIRAFATDDIVHRVSAYVLAKSDESMKIIGNDENAIRFLQNGQHEIDSEELFLQYISAFTALRSYDILKKRPNSVKKENAFIYKIPVELQWGANVHKTQDGKLVGCVTVVTGVYGRSIHTFEFRLNQDKKIEILRKDIIYQAVGII